MDAWQQFVTLGPDPLQMHRLIPLLASRLGMPSACSRRCAISFSMGSGIDHGLQFGESANTITSRGRRLRERFRFRIIHSLLEARRSRPVGSRPLFLLGKSRSHTGLTRAEPALRAATETRIYAA